MTHLYVSTYIYGNPLILEAQQHSYRSVGAWLACLMWRAEHRFADGQPDWFIPEEVARRELGRGRKALKGLLESGLWEVGNLDGVSRGYRMAGQGSLWRMSEGSIRPHIPESLRNAVYERDGHKCVTCGTTSSLSLDHIIPFSLGGPDTFDNLQAMCRSCNSRKGARV